MARNGLGTYQLPAGNPVVTGTTISSAWANTTLSDIAAALTQSISADGQTPFTAAIQLYSASTLLAAPANNDNSLKIPTTSYVYGNYVHMGSGPGQNSNLIEIGNSSIGKPRMAISGNDVGTIGVSSIDNSWTTVQTFLAGTNSVISAKITASGSGNAILQFSTVSGDRSLVQVGSSWQFLSNTNATVAQLDNSGNMTALTFTPTSDKRKKKDWTPATDAQLDAFFDLVDVGIFTWVDSGIKSLGAGAQDIEKIFPEAVHTDENGNKSVNYDGLNCVVLHGIGRRIRGKW